MNNLNSRSRDILQLLLQSRQPTPTSEIANQLGLTPRMVRFCLPIASSWLTNHGAILHSIPGKGITICTLDENRNKISRELHDISSIDINLTYQERNRALILHLLVSEKPLIIQELSSQLNISRATVIKDLGMLDDWFIQNRLKLVRKQNVGCWLEGEEIDLREVLIDFLVEETGRANFLPMLNGLRINQGLKTTKYLYLAPLLSNFLSKLELNISRSFILALRDSFGIQYSDDSLLDLILYTALMVYRIKIGRSFPCLPSFHEEISTLTQYIIAEKIIRLVEKRFYIYPDQSEILYLTLQLIRAELSCCNIVRPNDNQNKFNNKMSEIIPEILKLSSVKLHPSLIVDKQLADTLMNQLSLEMELFRFGVSIRIPLLRQVCKEFPYVYQIAKASCIPLKQLVGENLPDDAISTVALCLVAALGRLNLMKRDKRRILVVCNSGAIISWLLVSRIQTEISDLEIVGVVSANEIQTKMRFVDIDLVVSTIQLNIKSIPHIVVSPFLDPFNVQRLKKALDTIPDRPSRSLVTDSKPNNNLGLTDLLGPKFIDVKLLAKDRLDVVDQAGSLLLNSGAIEPKFIKAIKDEIEEYGPYMVFWPGIALLHADPKNGVLQLSMSLITLEHGVDFGNLENDPVYIAVVLGATDDYTHLRALKELQGLFNNPSAINKIRLAANKGELLKILKYFI